MDRREDKPLDLARQVNVAIVRRRTAFLPGEACDLKAFFDTVKHTPLLARLSEKIGGGNAPAAIAASPESEAIPHGRRHGVKPARPVVWEG